MVRVIKNIIKYSYGGREVSKWYCFLKFYYIINIIIIFDRLLFYFS